MRENELARQAGRVVKVMQMPDLRRRYIGRAVLALAAIIFIAALVMHRMSAAHDAEIAAGDLLTRARLVIEQQLPRTIFSAPTPLDDAFFNRIGGLAEQAQSDLDKVVASTSDPKLLAQAALLRGDLAFALASLPAPSPTTAASKPAPSLKTSHMEYFSQATAAYQEVIDKYGEQPLSAIAAHFGLAAVAQNRGEWAAAQGHYKAILDHPDSPPSLKQRAQQLLNGLGAFQHPPVLAKFPVEPLVTPTTMPAATQSATQPIAATPATRPATTRPTTTTTTTTTSR